MSTDDVENQDQLLHRESAEDGPITDPESKTVMLRAERHDEIDISVVERIGAHGEIPESAKVVKRTNPYFGPKLVLHHGTTNYMLTAPGPDTQLLLWAPRTNANGLRYGWKKLAEVIASFAAQQPQYDLCPVCGDPVRSLEHERQAGIGGCNAE